MITQFYQKLFKNVGTVKKTLLDAIFLLILLINKMGMEL